MAMTRNNERIKVTRTATHIEHEQMEDVTKGEMVATLFHRLSAQELASVYARAQQDHPQLKNRVVFVGAKRNNDR